MEESSCLGVSFTPHVVRLLLTVEGVERLRATLPPLPPGRLSELWGLLDSLSQLLREEVPVVLVAEDWGEAFATGWCTRCDGDEGHEEGPGRLCSAHGFEVLRRRMNAVMP